MLSSAQQASPATVTIVSSGPKLASVQVHGVTAGGATESWAITLAAGARGFQLNTSGSASCPLSGNMLFPFTFPRSQTAVGQDWIFLKYHLKVRHFFWASRIGKGVAHVLSHVDAVCLHVILAQVASEM